MTLSPSPFIATERPGLFVARLLAAVLFLLGPLIYAAPLSAAVQLPVATVIVGTLAWRQSTFGWGRIGRSLVPWLPMFALMLASAGWALDGKAALVLAGRLILVITLGIGFVHWCRTLEPARLPRLLPALACGLMLANALVLADIELGGPLSRVGHVARTNVDFVTFYGRGATVHAILLAPLGWGLWRAAARRLAVAQAVLAAATILATHDLSAKVALAGAIGGGLLVLALPRLRWTFLALLAVVALGLPLAFPVQLDQARECWMFANKKSALHRIYIWDFVTERIADKPILGWGLDGARRMPGGQDTVALGAGCPDVASPMIGEKLPLHPHNAILQTWLELGAVGIVLSFGALIVTLGRIYAGRRRVAASVLVAASVAGTLVALVSYGVWQEWFLSALMLASGIAALAIRQDELAPATRAD
ncbi:MAG TPA: O-antigen ligase family protein [Aliidongia sp.]|uniref:O-antigen ligase family protein n=1 Tax=Aliidongia sp. TaxID=1914230 RepID=UPI002DDCB223|nr:O-antigen ligase family protein [Aliidongia sp.]HEV2675998.1 O-antigen ligase family protein [Aliidongia sp.]